MSISKKISRLKRWDHLLLLERRQERVAAILQFSTRNSVPRLALIVSLLLEAVELVVDALGEDAAAAARALAPGPGRCPARCRG